MIAPGVARRLRAEWAPAALIVVLGGLGLLTDGFATPAAAGGDAAGMVDTVALDRFVEQQMDRHRIPGLALALVDGGRGTYAKGYGNADRGGP